MKKKMMSLAIGIGFAVIVFGGIGIGLHREYTTKSNDNEIGIEVNSIEVNPIEIKTIEVKTIGEN